MDSEKIKDVLDKSTGRFVKRWVAFKIDNHRWDCECMQVVVAMMAGLLSVLSAFEVEEEEPDPVPQKVVPTKEPSKRPKSSVYSKLKTPPHRQPSQLEMFV